MIFKDLVLMADFDKVVEALMTEYYNENQEMTEEEVNVAYGSVFQELISIEPVDSKEGMVLNVEKYNDWYDPTRENWDVSGIKPGDEDHYALEYSPWEEWLGLEVNESQLDTISTEEYVAHCLYELTFCGFDQETVQDQFDILKERCDEVMTSLNIRELVEVDDEYEEED